MDAPLNVNYIYTFFSCGLFNLRPSPECIILCTLFGLCERIAIFIDTSMSMGMGLGMGII